MKTFFTSVYLVILSFLGFNKQNIAPVQEPTPIITQIPSITPEESITPTIKISSTLKPTIAKPQTSITEEVLRKFFGFSDIGSINQILNNKDQWSRYESEYYKKYQKLPIPRLELDLNKLYGMPGKNGTIICTGSQLKSLYDEISIKEKEYEYQKMDYDCHHNRSMQETKECQDWRRINDQNKPTETPRSSLGLDQDIKELERKMKEQMQIYDQLIEKYCH